jgi:hypothetical protein
MAVPAHVVPVSHSFWDGFESYKLTGDISSEWSCAKIAGAGADDLATILKQTAQDTLTAIRAMDVEAVGADGHSVSKLDGSAFWAESDDDGFGAYGELGNQFGKTRLDNADRTLQISDVAYNQFKRQQMKAAVRASLRALVWTLQPR